MKHYTSIEQSKKLLSLGLSPETADMVYLKYADSNNSTLRFEGAAPMVLMDIPIDEIDYETLPCWSLGALLEMMPKEDINIPITDEDFVDCPPRECWFFLETCTWSNEYLWFGGFVDSAHCHKPSFMSNDVFEVVYNTVVWLLENNHLKTESPLTPSVNK